MSYNKKHSTKHNLQFAAFFLIILRQAKEGGTGGSFEWFSIFL